MEQGRATRGSILAWTLFDFANTAFYVVIITVVFPPFFTGVIAEGNAAYWGRAVSISMILTALIGPLLGSIADATNRKKLFLGICTTACVVATLGLYTTGPGTLLLAMILVIVANIGFEAGTIFYDAFLPDLTSEENYGKVSGYGFAMGYLGSLVILLTILPILSSEPLTRDDIRLTFLIAAGFFALFSLPFFLSVKEKERIPGGGKGLLLTGYGRLRETFGNLRRYDAVKRFLLAFFVYNDSILTVILFASIYGTQELKLDQTALIVFFLIVQGTALVGSLLFGRLTNRIGARLSIIITLGIWICVVVSAYMLSSIAAALGVTPQTAFSVVGGIAGIALGSSQSSSRTMMALLTPREKKTEFFGFYDGFFGKASATLGPLLFGEIARVWDLRSAMLLVGVLFIGGILLMLRVPDVRASRPDVGGAA